jgi:predicted ATPase/transcriptional regulator with XRE-family HTH domain
VLPLGAMLKRLRDASGLTQEELADRAGVSARTISDVERGLRSSMYRDTAERLAGALALDGAALAEFIAAARGRGRGGSGRPEPIPPVPPSPLIGRSRELESLLALVGDPAVRLVTVTGPGGIGKTRLALECTIVARKGFVDGAAFVPLASVHDSDLFASTVATALGVRTIDGQPIDALVAHLRGRHTLLVLDTFEHIVAAAGDVATLLASCPGLTVLATSREALRLRAEHEMPIPPLELPEGDSTDLEGFGATSLFLDRALLASPELPVTPESAAIVSAICVRLQGVPLAIELAAARLRHLTLPVLRDQLDRSLDVLTGGSRDLPDRQRTMRHTVAWSYDLLDTGERSLFRALSIFRGGWTLDGARAVWADEDPLEPLSGLIDKSLVGRPRGGDAETRYRMLDVIREFAEERRQAEGETAALGERHAAHLLELAERAEAQFGAHSESEWMVRLDDDRDDLRAALAWALDHDRPDVAQRLGGALWQYWRARGDLAEGSSWLDRALAIDHDPTRSTRGKALWGAAWLAFQSGDQQAAGRLSVEFLAFARRRRDPLDTRNALTIRGMVALAERHAREAVVSFRECVAISRTLDRGWLIATSVLNLGLGLLHMGDASEAEAHLEEAIGLYLELGDRRFAERARAYLAVALAIGDRPDEARAAGVEALRRFHVMDDAAGTAEAFEALAAVDALSTPLLGAYEAAAAQRLRERIGNRQMPFDARLMDKRLRLGRRTVDERQWRSATADGSDADLDAAVGYAAGPARAGTRARRENLEG